MLISKCLSPKPLKLPLALKRSRYIYIYHILITGLLRVITGLFVSFIMFISFTAQDHERYCLYKPMKCLLEGCEESFLKSFREEHELQCVYRSVRCEHCKEFEKVIYLEVYLSGFRFFIFCIYFKIFLSVVFEMFTKILSKKYYTLTVVFQNMISMCCVRIKIICCYCATRRW